jgi:very-short-patch-repair endonuclease
LEENEIAKKYNTEDSRDWKIGRAKEDIKNNIDNPKVWQNVSYRPFDIRKTFYSGKQNGFVCNGRYNVMKHLLNENIGFIAKRGFYNNNSPVSFITKHISDRRGWSSPGMQGAESVFPLYLYPEKTAQQNLLETNTRTPNLNPVIVKQIAEGLGLTFTNEKTTPSFGHPSNGGELAPIDLLDYIYAVLHSPTYREKYKEFLKIDFPRVPYPSTLSEFKTLTELGAQLRQIHLLESPIVEKYITQYPEDGDNIVTKPRFENSPPLEGCPSGGVVPNTTSQNEINPHTAPNNFMDPNTFIKNNSIYFKPILELPYNIKLKPRAKELRQAENLSEVLFWMQVTKDQFYSIDFDRQRIIGNYIVDFYVKKLGLVIEIDGASHDTKVEYDKAREDYLLSLGLKVYRIPVVEVLQNMKGVMRNLEEYIIENYGKPLVNSSKDKNPPHPAGTPPKEGDLAQLTNKENIGRVYINETQYFANVPEVAWNFYIGGYQPCQKWLKDRKGRELNYDDILHYQKIVVALSETDRIMKEIDIIKI